MDTPNPSPPLLSTATSDDDELHLLRFHSTLKWFSLDHSSLSSCTFSHLSFLALTLLIPLYFSLLLPTFPSTLLSQLPQSILAAISFFTLYSSFHLLDGIRHDPPGVRRDFTSKIDRAFRRLAFILLPTFFLELSHKILFFSFPTPWKAVALAAAMTSWVYRAVIFLLECMLFSLTCELQIMRFEEFYKMFEFGGEATAAEEEEEAETSIFREHVRIRSLLRSTSHRYRVFIIGCLVTITVSQLGALMMVFVTKGEKNLCNSGDLVVIMQTSPYVALIC